MLAIKIALVQLVMHCDIKKTSKTPEVIEYSAKSVTLGSKVGLPMNLVQLERKM